MKFVEVVRSVVVNVQSAENRSRLSVSVVARQSFDDGRAVGGVEANLSFLFERREDSVTYSNMMALTPPECLAPFGPVDTVWFHPKHAFPNIIFLNR